MENEQCEFRPLTSSVSPIVLREILNEICCLIEFETSLDLFEDLHLNLHLVPVLIQSVEHLASQYSYKDFKLETRLEVIKLLESILTTARTNCIALPSASENLGNEILKFDIVLRYIKKIKNNLLTKYGLSEN